MTKSVAEQGAGQGAELGSERGAGQGQERQANQAHPVRRRLLKPMLSRLTLIAQKSATWTLNTKHVLAIGIASTVLITLCSFVVGFLGTASPLWGFAPFVALRGNPFLVTFASVLLIIATFGLIFAWLALGHHVWRDSKSAWPLVVRAVWTWSIPLVFALPVYSKDVFSYYAQGSLLQIGLDPYRWAINAVPSWSSIGVDSMWSSTVTPYGPVSLLIQLAIVAGVGGLGYHAVLYAFRLAAIAGGFVIIWFSLKIANITGANRTKVLWAVGASPLFITTIIASGHNDAWMLAFMLAGLYLAYRRHPIWGIILVTLAIAVKSIALVALPVVALIYLGNDSKWRTRLYWWIASLAISFALLYAIGATIGIGIGWVAGLGTPATTNTWFAPTFLISAMISGVLTFTGVPFTTIFTIVKVIGMLAGVGLGGYVLLTPRRMDPLVRLAIAFSAVIILSPVIYPWYVLWPVVVAAAAGLINKPKSRFVLSLIVIFMVGSNIVDPGNFTAPVLPFELRIAIDVIGLVIGIGFLAAEIARHRGMMRTLLSDAQREIANLSPFE